MIKDRLAQLYLKLRRRPDSFEILEQNFITIQIRRKGRTRKNQWEIVGTVAQPSFRPFGITYEADSIIKCITYLVVDGPGIIAKVQAGEVKPIES